MQRLRCVGSILGRHAEICVTLTAWALLIVVIAIWIRSPDDLSAIRDYGLLIAAIVAFPLGFWRSRVAERQADAARRQVETAQQGLLNERHQQGAEMLASDVLAVRLGGIYALQRLAKEHPESYHTQNMQLLCAFVRHPTRDSDLHESLATANRPKLRQDVQTALDVITAPHVRQYDLEQAAGFRLELAGANLAHAILWNADLSGAILWEADVTFAQLNNADLMGAALGSARLCAATLVGTNLAYSDLHGVDFANASMQDANLSNAQFSKLDGEITAKGLTQSQLNSALAHPHYEPELKGVSDAQTGEPLIWQYKSEGDCG